MTKRLAVAFFASGCVALLAYVLYSAYDRMEIVEFQFATRAAAEDEQFIGPDRLIPALPPSAKGIAHAHHYDSQDVWMRYSFQLGDSLRVIGPRVEVTREAVSDRTRSVPRPPRSWSDAMQRLGAVDTSAFKTYRGAGMKLRCLGIDWRNLVAYEWSC